MIRHWRIYPLISRSFLNIFWTIIYHWKAGIQSYPLVVIVLYYTLRYKNNRAKKSNVDIFHLYFLKWDISFIIINKLNKLFVANLRTLLEGTVSQIFYLRLSLNFMTKNGKLFAFFQNFMVPSIILLRITWENLNLFYWIITEIFPFKNIKVKNQILIYFALYCYHFCMNYYITGPIE